jgi:serralysin
LHGDGGADELFGRDGSDVLIGGAGADLLDGGAGIDTASYATAAGAVLADLMRDPSWNNGDAYRDTYISIENLNGSAYADSLRGNDAGNSLDGGDGADQLHGRGGNDVLIGGAGADLLLGGSNADRFVFRSPSESLASGPDSVMDFVSGTDTIDLRQIDANALLSGDQAFTYQGSTAFTGAAAQLTFSDWMLRGDTDGDRVANFEIEIRGIASLPGADIFL